MSANVRPYPLDGLWPGKLVRISLSGEELEIRRKAAREYRLNEEVDGSPGFHYLAERREDRIASWVSAYCLVPRHEIVRRCHTWKPPLLFIFFSVPSEAES